MAQKPALGKGLASLLSAATPGVAPAAAPVSPDLTKGSGAVAAGPGIPVESVSKDRFMGISLVNIEDIMANQFQPRRDFDEKAIEELSQSIRINGIIQPLVVRKTPQGFQLIAGERRLRASKLAGLKQVPIVIRKSTDKEALELALIENIQRQDLNCVDEALAYFQLVQDFSLTQEEVARRVGKERATVANFLRLLKLPEVIIDDLKQGILTPGHGKVLLGLEDAEIRLQARAQIVEKRLSVRDSEILVDTLKKQGRNGLTAATATTGQSVDPVQARFQTVGQDLCKRWGTRVEVKGSQRRGKIVVHYTSRQELERLLAAMQS